MPVVITEQMVEAAAKAIYDVAPHYESGEFVDGFPVSPGGDLTWDQAKARDAEFGDDPLLGKITQFPYQAARAALEAALPCAQDKHE
jgi:hypothetical protein